MVICIIEMLRMIPFTRRQGSQCLRRYLHDSKLPHVTGDTDLKKQTKTIGVESPRKADYQMYAEANGHWDSIVYTGDKNDETDTEHTFNNRED